MFHDFSAPDEGNHECADCGVIVDTAVVDEVSIPCPVQLCQDPSNHDEPCVFVKSEDGAECAYCGRSGSDDADTP